MRRYKIADVVIEIQDDGKIEYPYFDKFVYDGDEKTEIVWRVVDEAIQEPAVDKWKDMKSFAVGKDEQFYYEIRYDGSYRHMKAMRLTHDFKDATFYLKQHKWKVDNENSKKEDFKVVKTPPDSFEDELAFMFREAFFLYIQTVDGISMHSASIIYRENGIAFSAVSGTGKSTHSNLWHQYYNTAILDGDIAVCRVKNDKPYIYGLPWAGSSGLMENKRMPLLAVVFINQSKECSVSKPDILQVMQRLMIANFTPTWLPEFHKQQIKNLKQILKQNIYYFNLYCDISKNAVDLLKTEIDRLLK